MLHKRLELAHQHSGTWTKFLATPVEPCMILRYVMFPDIQQDLREDGSGSNSGGR